MLLRNLFKNFLIKWLHKNQRVYLINISIKIKMNLFNNNFSQFSVVTQKLNKTIKFFKMLIKIQI